ncbi:MAG: hypothetical protein IH948_00090 [Bacteroidetes bacterium]|nr:hypothetical protein [Bacteroidota bacterium]
MKFKVGDRVKVTADRSDSSQELNGRTGKITCLYNDSCTLDIETRHGSGLWLKEIELIDKKKEIKVETTIKFKNSH